MSQDKQMKAVSPLLQRVINISSIVGGVGSLIFCIWAYQAGILQSKETLSAFIQQAGIWGPPLFIFTDFTDCRPYHSRGLDLGGWGLYLRAHHRDYLQLYRHRDWLCHYLLSSAPIRSCLCPVCRQQAHLRQVHRLAR